MMEVHVAVQSFFLFILLQNFLEFCMQVFYR